MYRLLTNIAKRFFSNAQIYKYGFNWSPMYRRTTGKVIEVSDDLYVVKIKIPLNWKNRNFVGTLFGGSMLSATDPIYMIQLMNILGDNYIVWDKEASIKYKRPGKGAIYCEFKFSKDEIKTIKAHIANNGEMDLVKTPKLIDKEGNTIAELRKTIYVANKAFFKDKRKQKLAAK